jgi:MFS family permease
MMPSLAKNSQLFIIFSVFFNARAYYPVLAILFLDLGLTLDQFVLLNLIWAATIFLFEVPSGAMADTIGRRKLLIASACLMLIEMLCLLLAPRNGGATLLLLCVINRMCSGLSEACASGADEALAYDSLAEENRKETWDHLLVKVMRWRSVGFVIAMILGGLVYDAEVFNYFLPTSLHLSVDVIHRIPVMIVFCQALVCLYAAISMVEPPRHNTEFNTPIDYSLKESLLHAFTLTLTSARWVLTHPKLLVVIVIGVALDSIVRNFATINSSYFRLIEIPEWTYGFIGAGVGVLSWFVPSLAKKLSEKFTLMNNLNIVSFGVLLGLIALVPAWKFFGVIPTLFLMAMLGFVHFNLSRVLHEETDSSRRATVLSVKGLMFNLGYGLFSLAFSLLLAGFSHEQAGEALRSALFWQVPYFVVLMVGLFVWARGYRKNC